MDAKVPQNIDMEDKLIGPLTFIQFLYLLFGGMAIYLLNNWTTGSIFRIVFYPLALIIAVLSLALAFFKIQQRPFSIFLISFIKYLTKPKILTWKKSDRPDYVRIVEKQEVQNIQHKEVSGKRIAEVAHVLDDNKNNYAVNNQNPYGK